MDVSDIDCVTFSYIAGVICLGVGLYLVIGRRLFLSAESRHTRNMDGWAAQLGGGPGAHRAHPGGILLEGCDALLVGIVLLLMGAHMLWQPGVLLAWFKVCRAG